MNKNLYGISIEYEISTNEIENLTLDEVHLIIEFTEMKFLGKIQSIIIKISRRYHLDFIDWSKKDNHCVIICKNKL